jgi:pathogenesis-related protein 1
MLAEARETMPRINPLAPITALAALTTACYSYRPVPPTRPVGMPDAAPAAAPAPAPSSKPRAPADRGRESPPAATPGDPEPGRLAGITAAHNRVRERVGVPPLEWSPELARYAQRWADKLKQRGCQLDHRPGSGPDAQRHGENLFASSGYAPTAAEVADSWSEEVVYYDAKTNRCKGGICGHYTQVVWRTSQRLGCAMAACGDAEVWVCNYDPPGNYIGKRPY